MQCLAGSEQPGVIQTGQVFSLRLAAHGVARLPGLLAIGANRAQGGEARVQVGLLGRPVCSGLGHNGSHGREIPVLQGLVVGGHLLQLGGQIALHVHPVLRLGFDRRGLVQGGGPQRALLF
jgi:hypothetical protein